MNCGTEDGTIVSCHSNNQEHGKGMGLKAHDGMIAWLCMRCHSNLDQGSAMTKQERREFMLTMICRTYMKLWDLDLIKAK